MDSIFKWLKSVFCFVRDGVPLKFDIKTDDICNILSFDLQVKWPNNTLLKGESGLIILVILAWE